MNPQANGGEALIPEHWLLGSDDPTTRRQMEDLLSSARAPMAGWRRNFGLVRTLETSDLEGEVAKLIETGCPCVHVLVDGGAPGLDLRLKAKAPPLERYRVVVRRFHDESKLRLVDELAGPDAWPLLAWHFDGRRSVPELPISPEFEALAREHSSAFQAWASSLSEEDRTAFDDLFGDDLPGHDNADPLDDQPQPGDGGQLPGLDLTVGLWIPPVSMTMPAALAAQSDGAEPTWKEVCRWAGPSWTVALQSKDGRSPRPLKMTLTLNLFGHDVDEIQLWMIPPRGIPIKLKIGRVTGAIQRDTQVTFEQPLPAGGLSESDLADAEVRLVRVHTR